MELEDIVNGIPGFSSWKDSDKKVLCLVPSLQERPGPFSPVTFERVMTNFTRKAKRREPVCCSDVKS